MFFHHKLLLQIKVLIDEKQLQYVQNGQFSENVKYCNYKQNYFYTKSDISSLKSKNLQESKHRINDNVLRIHLKTLMWVIKKCFFEL